MTSVLKPLAERVQIPLRLTATVSTTDEAIQNKIFGSVMTALIITNDKMDYIMKRNKSIKHSGLLIKNVIKTVENEAK